MNRLSDKPPLPNKVTDKLVPHSRVNDITVPMANPEPPVITDASDKLIQPGTKAGEEKVQKR